MTHIKLGVQCGGPSKPVKAGTKLASEACPDCGAKHTVEPTSSGASTDSPKSGSSTSESED